MSTDGEDDQESGFLKRWSNRKSEVEDSKSLAVLDEAAADDVSPAEIEAAPAKVLTDEDMPPLDSLHEGSDFSGFMSEGVSAVLRKAALKKLFSQPAFNIRDGLNDYDDDYTSFAPLGDTVTVEMSYRAEVDAKREALKKALLEEENSAVKTMDNASDEDADEEDETQVEEENLLLEEHVELTHEQENPDESSQ